MKIIEKTGIDAIGIHGRTKDQRPNHANNTDAIRFIIFRKFRKKREIVDIYLKIFYSFYFLLLFYLQTFSLRAFKNN